MRLEHPADVTIDAESRANRLIVRYRRQNTFHLGFLEPWEGRKQIILGAIGFVVLFFFV